MTEDTSGPAPEDASDARSDRADAGAEEPQPVTGRTAAELRTLALHAVEGGKSAADFARAQAYAALAVAVDVAAIRAQGERQTEQAAKETRALRRLSTKTRR